MEQVKTDDQVKIIMKSSAFKPFFIREDAKFTYEYEVETISESILITLKDLYEIIDNLPSTVSTKSKLDSLTRNFGEKCMSPNRIKLKGKYQKLI
jgi:hypothetical protein